VISGVSADESS